MPALPKYFLLLPFVLLAIPAQAIERTATHQPIPAAFVDRVHDYAAVQRLIVRAPGPPLVWSQAEQVLRHQRRFANRMREVTPLAHSSGVFTPDMSKDARDRIDTIVQAPAPWNQQALADFMDHVNYYAALQRTIVKSLGPPLMSSNWKHILLQQRRYADAMREARPGARQGGFFTPAVSRYFRDRIDAIVRETGIDVATAFEPPDENEILILVFPRAGEPVPWNAGPMMWPSMIAALPELPPELEYRFLGSHLVLVDVLANLVVDVLHDALPEPESSSS